MDRRKLAGASVAALAVAGVAAVASAQDVREFSFGYDQPKSTAYGFAGDLFEAQIAACSNGAMKINQFPGAQLGQDGGDMGQFLIGDREDQLGGLPGEDQRGDDQRGRQPAPAALRQPIAARGSARAPYSKNKIVAHRRPPGAVSSSNRSIPPRADIVTYIRLPRTICKRK